MARQVSARPRTAPYGAWRSPITADAIAAGVIGLSQIQIDGDDLYWVEQRPAEGGRNVIVSQKISSALRGGEGGGARDVTPRDFNARSRVHEYGGGAYLVREGTVWFTNFNDQRLYRQQPGHQPVPITPAKDIRHADLVFDAARKRLIAIREDHSTGARWALNSIVSLDPSRESDGATLVEGNDFYASPRVNPSGTHLAWLTWNHPNMPWDGTELWVGELTAEGAIRAPRKVAGGSDESIGQPTWSVDGSLYFVSDRTNWWNLYRWKGQEIETVTDLPAELSGPQWLFGMTTYSFESDRRMVCQVRAQGVARLAAVDLETKQLTSIDSPVTAFQPFLATREGRVYTIAGSPTEPLALVGVAIDTGLVEVLRRSVDIDVQPSYISIARSIEFPTEGGVSAHAFYYAPLNPDYQPAEGELPPLVVYIHGGPTGAVGNALDLSEQFWTSRGFGYLVVNYGGSTGFGREYRQRLNGKWGIVDVADAVNGARYLVDRSMVDGNRIAITGGSAGGYTVLRAMTSTDYFRAGASHFGISDLEVFHSDTHKFESMYDQNLIGRWPEDRAIYRERSAIHAVDKIKAPIILFQGLEDKIVPPNQAEIIVAAMRKKGLPVAYIAFEGEQHGFRIGKNIKRALEAELYFYSRIFGFELPESVEPVKIENL